MNLRPYQQEALNAIVRAARAGIRRQLIVLPTGAGKTVVFASLIAWLLARKPKRVLVLAHRDELVRQAAGKIAQLAPGATVGIEKAEERADDAQVVVASVPTLARSASRLEQFDPAEFGLVITDEAHHATASSYQAIYRHFRCGEADGPVLLGVTATPYRTDGDDLGEVFSAVVFELSLRDMMEARQEDPDTPYLCRPRGWRVVTDTDLSGLRTTGGDFSLGELAERVNTPERNRLAVRSYLEVASGKPALFFAIDVQHCRDLHAALEEAGVPAAVVVGETPDEERQEALRRYQAGELQALVNANVLTEGTDLPCTAAIVLARPTRSRQLLTQMIGRGLRKHPSKDFCAIIDLADASRSAVSAASVFGLPKQWKSRGTDLVDDARELETLAEANPGAAREATSLDDARKHLREFNLFDPHERRLLESLSPMAWICMPDGSYRLQVRERGAVRVHQDLLGHWQLALCENGMVDVAGSYGTLGEALSAGDDVFRSRYPAQLRLVDRSAAWRQEPATERQVQILRKHGLWKRGVTKGEASVLLDHHFQRQPLRRGREAAL